MVLLTVLACFSPPEAPPHPRPPSGLTQPVIDVDDPEVCRACHETVVEEWTQSMHAHAHFDEDPIHGGMRALRMKKEGEAIADKCAQCHTPRSPDAVDARAAKVGVSCSACHLVAEIHRDRGPGAKALVYGQTMRGPHDLENGASPVHPVGEAPGFMKDGTALCLACHDATKTPAGAAACTTGPEHREGGSEETCVSCHMPMVDGPAGEVNPRNHHASHRFHGPHDAWNAGDPSFVAGGLSLAARFEGDTLEVTLDNLTGHGFPTGFPGRMAFVSVRGLDASGEEVWTSGPPDAATLMNKVYVDADGKPAPAAFAAELKVDRRLKADETRAFRFDLPARVAKAEASLVMRLLPPPLADKLGLADRPEGEPRTITTVTATR